MTTRMERRSRLFSAAPDGLHAFSAPIADFITAVYKEHLERLEDACVEALRLTDYDKIETLHIAVMPRDAVGSVACAWDPELQREVRG